MMYRQTLRAATSSLPRAVPKQGAARRLISTAPPHQKSRSWKSSAVRWGAAGSLVYYYNTYPVFAEEPAYAIHAPPEASRETETYPTIEAVAEQRRAQAQAQAASSPSQSANIAAPDAAGALAGSPDGLEEEASQQGAFNEETGEINWDCPCLGGMAHGPCGEQFKAAFSCFVYSKEEPKGVDCIEHFKTMQNCFRDHPDVYGSELEDDDAPPPESPEGQPTPAATQPTPAAAEPEAAPMPSLANVESPHGRGEKVADHTNANPDPDHVIAGKAERAKAATEQVRQDHDPTSESDSAVPKAAHDAR